MRGVFAMTDLLPFVVIGITTGSVYGLAAMGLVLTYKTSGIFNFAHGAIAALAAFAFYELHTIRGLPWPLALILAVVVLPPLLALGMERIARGLEGASTTMKIVATIGLQLGITSALVAYYGSTGLEFPRFLPDETFDFIGINVGADQLISIGAAVTGAVAFFVFFRFSPMGVQMRAVVDNPDLLALTGTSAFAVRSWAWLIGCWFAALSGVLLAPQIGLDAMLLTLLVVQAYGAAAVGLFSSLPMTYAGGLLVGLLAALATNFVSGSSLLSGLPPALPFLVLFAVLLIAGKGRLVEVGSDVTAPLPPSPAKPVAARVMALVAITVGVVLPFVVGPKLPVYSTALVLVLVFYSLQLLVRTSGQVSLAHAGLVAVGAAAFSHLAVGAGLPWLVAVLLAGAVAIPVGAIVAIPAIRLSGLFLALATYGFGLLLEKVVYRSEWMFGTTGGLPAPRPGLFESDTAFYYVLLVFAVAGASLVTVIGSSRLGRLLRAMADSPTSLATLGLGVNVTRVTVFAISAFIAGIAGALYATLSHSASGAPFSSYISLTWLALLVLNSGARSGAPVLAAIGLGIVPAYITNVAVVAWLPVVFGVGALIVAIQDGSARRGRGGVRSVEPTEIESSSRAVERIGCAGPVSARARTAIAEKARHGRPAVVRFGVSASTVKGVSR